jgi:uncharacterized protein
MTISEDSWLTFKTRKYTGIRGLAELPYFEYTDSGLLRLTVDDLQGGIDAHVHFALNAASGPKPDLLKRHSGTKYYFDVNNTYSLNNFISENQTPQGLQNMVVSMFEMLLPSGSPYTETHTLANLIAEMDLLNIEKAVVLPVAFGFPYGDDVSEWYMDAIERSGMKERFIICGSVKPTLPDAIEKVKWFKLKDVKGIKLHPNLNMVRPNDRLAWAFYEECRILNLPVLLHSGLIGREHKDLAKEVGYTGLHSDMKNFIEPIAEFPGVRFVLCHAGSVQSAEAIEIARNHKNVWLDLQGQGVDSIQNIIKELGPERLMFGSDYPICPVALLLARLLLATENDKTVRNMIFSDNARRFWDGAAG